MLDFDEHLAITLKVGEIGTQNTRRNNARCEVTTESIYGFSESMVREYGWVVLQSMWFWRLQFPGVYASP